MHIYIASYFNTRQRLKPVLEVISSQGHVLTASWLWESREGRGSDQTTALHDYTFEEKAGFAPRDYREIRQSDLIIVDTFDETPRGGREVELGYATGLGLQTWVVGPRRNVFHYIIHRHFEIWEDCLDALHPKG